jgi:hypothetical protein
MNKKDIALTVGGVLASFALAYLLYRLQQRDAAINAANAAASAQASQDAQNTQIANETSLESQLPTLNISGGNSTALSTAIDGSSDSSASAGATTEASFNSLLSNIIADFAPSITTQPNMSENPNIIPTVGNSGLSLISIPTSAAAALAGAGQALTTQTNGTLSNVPESTITNPGARIVGSSAGSYYDGDVTPIASTGMVN